MNWPWKNEGKEWPCAAAVDGGEDWERLEEKRLSEWPRVS